MGRTLVVACLSAICFLCNAGVALAVPNPPTAPSPPDNVPKNRFISIVPGNSGTSTAIRVRLPSLQHPNPPNIAGQSPLSYSGFESATCTDPGCCVRWVGAPAQYTESVSIPTTFYASQLQCTPYYQNWGTVALLHVTGAEIIPSSVYDMQAILNGADTAVESNYSAALTVTTARWGDVVEPFQVPSTPYGLSQPDVRDVTALCDKFTSMPGAPIKARAKLAGNASGVVNIAPDVGFGDISVDVDAIKGLRYPYTGPSTCPSAGACPPAEACGDSAVTGSEQCDDGNRTAGDGCAPSCRNEVCGDGVVQYPEACDDGNLLNGDGCTSGCLQEVICGNCRVDFGENCDDGNTVGGDGCSATCQWEGAIPTILTYPIDPPGILPPYPPGTVILGTEIWIPAGPQRLWFEVRIAGWSPRLLRSWQVLYGREMLKGVNASPPNPGVDLTPAVQSCVTDTGCAAALNGDTACGSGTSRCVASFCEAAFQNTCDTEWIFSGISAINFTSQPQIAFYGVTVSAGDTAVDAHGEYYAGTLVLDVPASAAGTYTLPAGFRTLLLDENTCPIGDGQAPAAIHIGHPVLYVNASAAGANDGTSWTNAYRNLQDALSFALTDPTVREIWVAAGAYKPDRGVGIPPGDRTATFQLKNGVALYGGFAGTETLLSQRNPSLNTTILSGDLNGDDANVACTQNSPDCDSFGNMCDGGFCIIANNNGENTYTAVVTGSGTDSTAVLDGFRISACNGDGFGMANMNGSPTVANCMFIGNNGGMVNSNSNSTITNCTFRGNGSAVSVGGMYNDGGSPNIANCTFSMNSADFGGGMRNVNGASSTVTNCRFIGNLANVAGGGMLNGDSHSTVTNCTFSGNTAISAGGGMQIGGSGSATVTNCIFSGNSSGGDGGGVHNQGTVPSIINGCTFSGNSATNRGGGLSAYETLTVANCIFYGNSAPNGAQIFSFVGPTVSYSLVQGGFAGTGNINANPLFFNPSGLDGILGTSDDDLRLRHGSPAIDAGNDTAVPLDTLDLDHDGNTTERIPIDLAGHPRFFNDPATSDTGVADPPTYLAVVDMGAYEFFPDCNHNGVLDSTDISLGTSKDCNSNGIPDECDIAACPATKVCAGGTNNGLVCTADVDCPAGTCSVSWAGGCHDCNLNGIPDGCDIALGTLHDVNLDGIPDECIVPTPGVNWSDPVWGLGTSAPYPDNLNANASPNRCVTLPATVSLLLDRNVQINSLTLQDGSTLKVIQTDADNLSIKSPGNMLIEGNLLVAHDRAVNVPGGTVTVGPGGAYMKDPSAARTTVLQTSACLTASGLKLVSCLPPCSDMGGLFELADSMCATINGDFTIDATQVLNGPCQSDLEGTVAGGYTPPIVRVKDHASIGLFGDLVLLGAANVIISPTDPLTTPVSISGNFDNQSVRPECFFCRNGGFLLNGTAPQFFEVAGTDVGPVGSVDGTEFVIGAVEVASSSHVTFHNAFDNNGLGQASCEEALYVEILKLDASSTITLDNCRIYYQTLERDPSATVTLVGCGELLSVVRPTSPGADPTAINKGRAISFVPPATVTATAGGVSAIRVTLVALHRVDPPYTGGTSVPFTLFEGQSLYVGPPTQYVESASSGTPFYASQLQCAPEYRDWSTVGLLHVMGEAVVPSSTYKLEILAASCTGNEFGCTAVSAPLQAKTTRWGDVATPYYDPAHPEVSQPDTSDISSLVNKFKSALGAPIKARALLAGGNARGTMGPAEISPDMSFTHISLCVDAFKGLPYPYKPGKCTGDAAKACITDANCTDAPNPTMGPCVLCP